MTHDSGMSGADLVADTLIRLGCKHVFNITGLGMHRLVASFYKRRSQLTYLSQTHCSSSVALASARRT